MPPEPLRGDVDGDGQCSLRDAVKLAKYLAEEDEGAFSYEQADMDLDGMITVNDLILLLNQLGYCL